MPLSPPVPPAIRDEPLHREGGEVGVKVASQRLVLDEAVSVPDDPLPAPEPVGEPRVPRAVYLRVVKLMPPDDRSSRDDGVLGDDVPLDVPQGLKPAGHRRRRRQHPRHLLLRVAVLRYHRLTEVHQAAALAVDRHPVPGSLLYFMACRRLLQLPGIQLGVAAPEVEAVDLREGVADRAEELEIGSEPAEDLEVLGVVEAEGFVVSDGDSDPPALLVRHHLSFLLGLRLRLRHRDLAAEVEDPVEVCVLLEEVREGIQVVAALKAHQEPQVAARKGYLAPPGEGGEDRDFQGREGLRQEAAMAVATDPVEDEPRYLHAGVVAPVAEGHRRGGPARPVDVHHQEDGGSEGFCDGGRRRHLRRVEAVVEAHDAFDDGDVRALDAFRERAADSVCSHH